MSDGLQNPAGSLKLTLPRNKNGSLAKHSYSEALSRGYACSMKCKMCDARIAMNFLQRTTTRSGNNNRIFLFAAAFHFTAMKSQEIESLNLRAHTSFSVFGI
jgi:hypothetical protein